MKAEEVLALVGGHVDDELLVWYQNSAEPIPQAFQ